MVIGNVPFRLQERLRELHVLASWDHAKRWSVLMSTDNADKGNAFYLGMKSGLILAREASRLTPEDGLSSASEEP